MTDPEITGPAFYDDPPPVRAILDPADRKAISLADMTLWRNHDGTYSLLDRYSGRWLHVGLRWDEEPLTRAAFRNVWDAVIVTKGYAVGKDLTAEFSVRRKLKRIVKPKNKDKKQAHQAILRGMGEDNAQA